ncbi:MAG: AEC family transporter [Candidatus Methylumidiphilus sp.]
MTIMFSVVALMALPILCGIGWRIIRPSGLDADLTRQVLTTVVFNLLLPALVLVVLWRSPLGWEALKISLFGIVVVAFGGALAWGCCAPWRIERRRLGAAILAIAFPNVTYFGLPVLEQSFGPWTRALVIQIDLFAAMPMVLTLGAVIGRHYGEEPAHGAASLWVSLLRNPPLWAAVLAVALNLAEVPLPEVLGQMLDKLAGAVVPLMLVSLGLGLRWDSWRWRSAPLSGLVLVLRLAVAPGFGWLLGGLLGFGGDTLTALVMEAGMPSMMLGVVYCDRYRLDTAFYAMVVALTTLAGLVSLPVWRGLG